MAHFIQLFPLVDPNGRFNRNGRSRVPSGKSPNCIRWFRCAFVFPDLIFFFIFLCRSLFSNRMLFFVTVSLSHTQSVDRKLENLASIFHPPAERKSASRSSSLDSFHRFIILDGTSEAKWLPTKSPKDKLYIWKCHDNCGCSNSCYLFLF